MAPVLLFLVLAVHCGGDDPTGGYAPALSGALERGSDDRTRGDMQAIATALASYMIDAGGYPEVADIDELASMLQPRYLAVVPRTDGWGAPLAYRSDGSSFTLSSSGPDGAPGGGDDVVMTDGGFR